MSHASKFSSRFRLHRLGLGLLAQRMVLCAACRIGGCQRSGNSLQICRHDSWRCWWLRIVRMLSTCTFTGLFLIVSYRELMVLVPRMSSWSVTVNGRILELASPSSVVTVTSRPTEPEVGMTSFDVDISGRVSSF